jgi:hypothetical protein
MNEWNGYLCNGVRLAVALLAAALGAASVAGAGDAWPAWRIAHTDFDLQTLRAWSANTVSSRSTNAAFAAASTKLASKPLRASA